MDHHLECPKPIITVVIPLYNGAAYIEETLCSVFSQTIKNYEVLVIDDGSTDKSLQIVRSFRDPRLRVITQSNIGLCATMNKGVQEARGQIIARLDQDDICSPDRLSIQYAALHSTLYDCLFSDSQKIGSNVKFSYTCHLEENNIRIIDYNPLEEGFIIHSTLFAKKELLLKNPYRDIYYPADDWDLTLRLSERYRLGRVSANLVQYRVHSSANTYLYFKEMQSRMRFANLNYSYRIQGLKEISFEEYSIKYSRKAFVVLNRWRKDVGRLFFRKAGDAYLNKKPWHLLLWIGVSFIFTPAYAYSKLIMFRDINTRESNWTN